LKPYYLLKVSCLFLDRQSSHALFSAMSQLLAHDSKLKA
jgi:hypothetical protein